MNQREIYVFDSLCLCVCFLSWFISIVNYEAESFPFHEDCVLRHSCVDIRFSVERERGGGLTYARCKCVRTLVLKNSLLIFPHILTWKTNFSWSAQLDATLNSKSSCWVPSHTQEPCVVFSLSTQGSCSLCSTCLLGWKRTLESNTHRLFSTQSVSLTLTRLWRPTVV